MEEKLHIYRNIHYSQVFVTNFLAQVVYTVYPGSSLSLTSTQLNPVLSSVKNLIKKGLFIQVEEGSSGDGVSENYVDAKVDEERIRAEEVELTLSQTVSSLSANSIAYDSTLNPSSILTTTDVQDTLDQIIIRGISLKDITGLSYAGTSVAGIRYKATESLPPNYDQSVRILNSNGQKVGSVNISSVGDMWLADASDVPLAYLWQGGVIVSSAGYLRLIDYFDRLCTIEYKFSPSSAYGQRRGFTVLREVNAVTIDQEMGILSNLKTDVRTSVISAINSIFNHAVLNRSIVNIPTSGTPIAGCLIEMVGSVSNTSGVIPIKETKRGEIIGNITWNGVDCAVNKTSSPPSTIYLKQNGQYTGVVHVLLSELFNNNFAVFNTDITCLPGESLGFDIIRIVDTNVLDLKIGLLANLVTTNKSSIVDAINEVYATAGKKDMSLEEQLAGYNDHRGKPFYRKTFTGYVPTTPANQRVRVDISNIGAVNSRTFGSVFGQIKLDNGTVALVPGTNWGVGSWPTTPPYGSYNIFVIEDGTVSLVVQSGEDLSGGITNPYCVTIEYTKE